MRAEMKPRGGERGGGGGGGRTNKGMRRMKDERQRVVVVKGPCGTKSRTLCPAVLAVLVS